MPKNKMRFFKYFLESRSCNSLFNSKIIIKYMEQILMHKKYIKLADDKYIIYCFELLMSFHNTSSFCFALSLMSYKIISNS